MTSEEAALTLKRHRRRGGRIVTRERNMYIRERDGGLCVYCGDIGQVIDHVVPFSRLGPRVNGNLVLACSKCNVQKSDDLDPVMLLKAFRHLVKVGESTSWLDKFERADNDEVALVVIAARTLLCRVCGEPMPDSEDPNPVTCSPGCRSIYGRYGLNGRKRRNSAMCSIDRRGVR